MRMMRTVLTVCMLTRWFCVTSGATVSRSHADAVCKGRRYADATTVPSLKIPQGSNPRTRGRPAPFRPQHPGAAAAQAVARGASMSRRPYGLVKPKEPEA